MKKLFLILVIPAFLMFTMGCGDDSTGPDDPVNEAKVLVDYLEGGSANYEGWVNTMSGWIVTPPNGAYGDSTLTYADYAIFDLRSSTDFANKHIPGAVNVTMTTMFTEAENVTKPILVVCYSGQTAAYAHMLLRMKGFEAHSLIYGMSGYAKSLDKWTNSIGSGMVGNAAWVTTASAALPEFELPVLSTGKETGAEILDARIEVAINEWATRLVAGSTVAAALSDYNIMNYWAEADYLHYGHFDGAYQLTPNTLTQAQNLTAFDPDGVNVLYCWTGQTAAATIAYLTVMGYDVKSVKYGVNSMIYDALAGHKWPMPY